jgi:hypothetical protein
MSDSDETQERSKPSASARSTARRMLVALGLGTLVVVVLPIWQRYGVRCDNDRLTGDLVRVEALATRSSQLAEAQGAAIASLVAGCEGAPAWVRDDLHYETMSQWPDRVTHGRDRVWLESWIVCDLENAQSAFDFDARTPGMAHCGFERLAALTPIELLDLQDTEFGFWAAGAYLERAGASPALLRRYYRVMLLAIDSQRSHPDLLVEPGRIFDLRNDEALTAQALGELQPRHRPNSLAIDARTPALQLDWHVQDRTTENWVLEQRSPTGLAIRARVAVIELATAVESVDVLRLELDGWRRGMGALQPYADLDPRAQSGERLVVILDGELTADRFMPMLAVLWRTLAAAPSSPEALTIAIDS